MNAHPRLLPVLLAALLVPLAGCLSVEEPGATVRSVEPPPDPRIWNGSALEGLSCTSVQTIMEVPVERVQPHLPDNLTTRGGVVVEVMLDVHHCDPFLLDHGAPMPEAWLYVAYTMLRSGPDVPADGGFLLEAGSDQAHLLDDLAARGVPVLEASFQRSDVGLTLSAPDTTYTLLLAGTDPEAGSTLEVVRNLLLGSLARDHLVLESPRHNWSAAPGVLTADGGILGTLLDTPRPLLATQREVGLLLRHPHPEE